MIRKVNSSLSSLCVSRAPTNVYGQMAVHRTRGGNFPFSYGDYIVKAVLGSVDRWSVNSPHKYSDHLFEFVLGLIHWLIVLKEQTHTRE